MKRILLAMTAIVLLLAPLAAASITVSSPNGTPWCINSPYAITWTSTGVTGNVDIILRPAADPSAPPTLGIAAGTSNDGSEGWSIPASVAPGNYLVRIRSVSDPTVYGDSAAFAINNCSGGAIQVIRPAGDPWCINGSYPIEWKSSGVTGDVDIILRPANAPTAPPALGIAAGTPNDGSEGWTIPASVAPGNYLVRIRSVNNPAVYGDSANFEIRSCVSQELPLKHDGVTTFKGAFDHMHRMREVILSPQINDLYLHRRQLTESVFAVGQKFVGESNPDPRKPGWARVGFRNENSEYQYDGYVYRTRVFFDLSQFANLKGKFKSALVSFEGREFVHRGDMDLADCDVQVHILAEPWPGGDFLAVPGVIIQNYPQGSATSFDISNWCQAWHDGTSPNHGMLFIGMKEVFNHDNLYGVSYYKIRLHIKFQEE